MSESAGLRELAEKVLASARETGFALIKANYVERKAPEMPGGTIRGLEGEARDIACALRDSIWTRFDSLRFHYDLLARVRHQTGEVKDAYRDSGFQSTWSAVWHSQYLFDDVIFNAASLFDYLGNAIWFGFHGKNQIKKKWNKAYEAAKGGRLEQGLPRGLRIHGSGTGQLVIASHESLVGALYDYRSDLIHNRMDGPDVFSHAFWEEQARSGLVLRLPRRYMRQLRRILADEENPTRVDMLAGIDRLIVRCGELALEILETLRTDIGYNAAEPITFLH